MAIRPGSPVRSTATRGPGRPHQEPADAAERSHGRRREAADEQRRRQHARRGPDHQRQERGRPAGAGLDFRVPFLGMKIFGGAKLTKQDTHTIGILLQPAARPAARAVLGGNPIEVALASAIATIRAAMATAAAGEDPLAIGSGTVTLEFAIERNGQVSLGAEGGLGQEVTHTLVLTLVPPAPATGHAGAASSAP